MMRLMQHQPQNMMRKTVSVVMLECQGRRTVSSVSAHRGQVCWRPLAAICLQRARASTVAAAGNEQQQVAAAGAAAAASSNGSASSGYNAYEDVAAQRRAYQYYHNQQQPSWSLVSWWRKQFRSSGTTTTTTTSSQQLQQIPKSSLHDLNMRLATYLAAVVMGALGATYASVPLYKLFCQATGFGGTTQRVQTKNNDNDNDNLLDDDNHNHYTPSSNSFLDRMRNALHEFTKSKRQSLALEVVRRTGKVHTWTDEDAAQRLATLQPVANAQLITVRMDSTVGDVLPWTFEPTQRHVKVVPGETALTFFRVTNHASHPIVGVATYNVYPPKMGLYFNKIQCFCFEEQRVLAGETVDMPVFFFIDPDVLNDGQMASLTDMTLSYTFFPTEMDDDDDDEEDQEAVMDGKQTKVYAS